MAALTIAKDENGDAVVEAAILFPIIIMIFAALVLLAIYLPTRAALQRATQQTATAIATERSDTWLRFNENALVYQWDMSKGLFPYVYESFFMGTGDAQSKGSDIITNSEGRGISSKAGMLTYLDCQVVNYIVYKEVVATATREFYVPGGLSFIGFPETIPITVTSTAVVQNGEDFVRNMDLVVEFISYISEKFGLTNVGESISSAWDKAMSFLGR